MDIFRTNIPFFQLRAENIAKTFHRRTVWSNISLSLQNGDIMGVTGHNGSGKTTLLRVLTGLLSPTQGKITCTIGQNVIDNAHIVRYAGFVAPYLTLYEEFSPFELLRFLAAMRDIEFSEPEANDLLCLFHLHARKHDSIRGFSSGMKQRCKYICALYHSPPLLVLDEPMSNLDAPGIEAVETMIRAHRRRQGALLLATNDERDLRICTTTLSVEP